MTTSDGKEAEYNNNNEGWDKRKMLMCQAHPLSSTMLMKKMLIG